MRGIIYCAALAVVAAGAAGCSKSARGATSGTATITGGAAYLDSETNVEGSHMDPVSPPTTSGNAWLWLVGPADVDGDQACSSEHQFRATYGGGADVRNGQIIASVAPDAPTVTTPSGCAISQFEPHGLEQAYVYVEIPATTEACTALCDGHARAKTEQMCGGQSEVRDCRQQSEGQIAAACDDACASASAIAGHGDVNTSKLGAISRDRLISGEFGDVEANVRFDQIVDANHQPLALP